MNLYTHKANKHGYCVRCGLVLPKEARVGEDASTREIKEGDAVAVIEVFDRSPLRSTALFPQQHLVAPTAYFVGANDSNRQCEAADLAQAGRYCRHAAVR